MRGWNVMFELAGRDCRCALGKTPEPDLAAHLAICPQCQNALRESRAMAARIDEALCRSAAVEPPLYGPERVMARIHGQTDTRAMVEMGRGWKRGVGRVDRDRDVGAASSA
jgi:hypothetical protein